MTFCIQDKMLKRKFYIWYLSLAQSLHTKYLISNLSRNKNSWLLNIHSKDYIYDLVILNSDLPKPTKTNQTNQNKQNQIEPSLSFNEAFLCPVRAVLQFLRCLIFFPCGQSWFKVRACLLKVMAGRGIFGRVILIGKCQPTFFSSIWLSIDYKIFLPTSVFVWIHGRGNVTL